jgi:hypothetical protein
MQCSTWLAYARKEKEITVDYNAEQKRDNAEQKKRSGVQSVPGPDPIIVHRLLVIA